MKIDNHNGVSKCQINWLTSL